MGSFIQYVRKTFRKIDIFYPDTQMHICGDKKYLFFGKFCVHTNQMIPMGIFIASLLVDFNQMYAHSRNVFRTLSNILKLLIIFSKSSIFDRVLTLRENCPQQEFFWSVFSRIRTRKTQITCTFHAVLPYTPVQGSIY